MEVIYSYIVGTEHHAGYVIVDGGKQVMHLRQAIWEQERRKFELYGVLVVTDLQLWLPGENKSLGVRQKLGTVFGDAAEKEVHVTPLTAPTWDAAFVVSGNPLALAPAAALTRRIPSALEYDGLTGRVYKTSRKKTVEGIAEAILEQGLVMIRGPPQSGKTCLVELLADHFGSMPEYRVDLLCMRHQMHKKSLDEAFMAAFNKPWSEYVDDKTVVKILLVDEAQVLFDEERWNSQDFFHYTRVRDPCMRIVLAIVRGCRENFSIASGVTLIPEQLKARTEVRLWACDNEFPYHLTLTDDEYVELWNSWLEVRQLQLTHYLKDYVGRICRMQPGLICPVLDYLHSKLVYGGVPQEKKESVAVQLLTTFSFYTTMEKKIRSMIDLKKTELVDFLLWLCANENENIHVDDIPAGFEKAGASLSQLGYYTVAENMQVSFVSPLHRMVFLMNHFKLTSRAKSTLEKFDRDFGKYITSAVGLMDTDILAKSAGITTARTRNERVFMDEFYRVGTSLLPHSVIWSPEVGFMFKVPGRVDYFCSELGWLIEGMRDGLNKEGHLERFREGGTYWRFFELGLVNNWAVLDFAPETVDFEAHEDGFWQIRFGEGYRAATIRTPEGETLTKHLHGMYTMEWDKMPGGL